MSVIRTVTVLGAGTMGHGIAQVAATAGHRVILRDMEQGFVDRGLARMDESLAKLEGKGRLPEAAAAIRARVTGEIDLANAVADADLVIEAIPERLELKVSTFKELDAHTKATAILASNTSSLPIAQIAAATSTPHRVIGLHFFNPVPIMKLVEVVRAPTTSDTTTETARVFAMRLGKEPIVVKDAPGFATSRLGVAIGLEAIRMLEEGVASAEDIDKAMTLGYNHPMGPLRLTDLVGLDVRLAIAEHLARELGPRFEPPARLREMVAAGTLGQKSGRGFFDW